MRDLIVNLLLAMLLLGGFVGWQARALIAERDEEALAKQRDDEWDAAHGIRHA